MALRGCPRTAQTWQHSGLGSGCSLQALQPWADFLLLWASASFPEGTHSQGCYTHSAKTASRSAQGERARCSVNILLSSIFFFLRTLDSYCFLGVLKYKKIKICLNFLFVTKASAAQKGNSSLEQCSERKGS